MAQRRSHADDPVILRVNSEVAANTAVGADGIGASLARFIPGSGLPHVVFALEHQSAGGANANTVSAIDAGRVRQWNIEFRGNVRSKSAAGYGDGESILRVNAAGFHAFVAKNAFRIITDVEIVVDFYRLRHRCVVFTETLRVRVVTLH